MYHHQLLYLKHLPETMNFTNRSDFGTFLKSYALADKPYCNIKNCHALFSGWRHTGSASRFCGLKYVKYDVYIDIDKISEGLQRLIDIRPEFKDVITTEWEPCTMSHSPSLMESETRQEHTVTTFGRTDGKLLSYDKLFCDNETVQLVTDTFHSDYEVFIKNRIFSKHTECLHLLQDYNYSGAASEMSTQSTSNLTFFQPKTDQSSLIAIRREDLGECWLCEPSPGLK